MIKKLIYGLAGAGLLVVLFLWLGNPRNDTQQEMISIGLTLCLPAGPGVSALPDPSYSRETFIDCCLLDTFSHFYSKSIVFGGDTLFVSALNDYSLKRYQNLGTQKKGMILKESFSDSPDRTLKVMSRVSKGYITRIMREEPTFKTCVLLDFYNADSLKTLAFFQSSELEKLIQPCK